MSAITMNLPTGTKLVILDIDRLKFCPYCGHGTWVEYIRDSDVIQTYKKCHNEDCDFKLVVT